MGLACADAETRVAGLVSGNLAAVLVEPQPAPMKTTTAIEAPVLIVSKAPCLLRP